jgi:peroxiredoxin
MSKAARIRAQRRTPPPPVAKRPTVARRTIWIATAGLVLVVAIVAGTLLATRTSPRVAGPAAPSASDRNAPASLVAAAGAVDFHPTTEPGVGEIEGRPADAATGPRNPDLLAVGSRAPPFTRRTPQGGRVSLASYRGKAVLLEFFATWCPHCNAEAPHLARLARSLAGRNVRFLSVNADGETAPSVYAFHRYYGLPYPALTDPGSPAGSFDRQGGAGAVTRDYNVEAFPTFYVIDPAGRITWRSDGEQPDAVLRAQLLEAARG